MPHVSTYDSAPFAKAYKATDRLETSDRRAMAKVGVEYAYYSYLLFLGVSYETAIQAFEGIGSNAHNLNEVARKFP